MNFTAYCPITGLSYKVITPEIFQEQITKTYNWKIPSPFSELPFLFKILQKNPALLDIETKTSVIMAAFYHLSAFSETDKTKIEIKRERIKESIIFAEKEKKGRFYYFFTIKQILESSPRLQKKITKISVAEFSHIALNKVLENWHNLIWPLNLNQIIHAEELEIKKTRIRKTKTIIPDSEILDDFLGIFTRKEEKEEKEEKKTISQILAEKKGNVK